MRPEQAPGRGRQGPRRPRRAPAPTPRGQAAWLPSVLGVLTGLLVLLGTVGWPALSAAGARLAADVHHYHAREAQRASATPAEVQRHLLAAVAADPTHAGARLDLARTYLDMEWYGGAIQQAEAVLAGRRSRAEASLAFTYAGYGHFMLSQEAVGVTELELAVQFDGSNALAQSLLERLERQGRLPAWPLEGPELARR